MAGMFEVYEDKAGQFRFRLKAGNGEIVATCGVTHRVRPPTRALKLCSAQLRALPS